MSKFKYASLVLATTLLMGLAFPVGKIGIGYAPPFFLMGIRFVVAGGILAAIAGRNGRPRETRSWLRAATIGMFQSAGVMGCAYYSMRWVSSGESSILISLNPLLVIVLGSLLQRIRYRFSQWAGVAIGFFGILTAFGFRVGFQPGTWIGIGGAFCFAAATLTTKRWGGGFDMKALAGYQMLFGGLLLLLLSMATERPRFDIVPASILALVWLIVFCSIAQFLLWYYLLSHGDAAKTSAFLFLMPLFGVLTSWLLLGERVHASVYAGGALVCLGIYLVNREPAAGGKSMRNMLQWGGGKSSRSAKERIRDGCETVHG
ncbi:DMT family transporter [Cohnella suwonensis]|uniref:DMT family transporter n=1 Tax=Cohnella suwonensis TaxID=696072 RepID=A0ABW0M1C4_9BACL